jgi:hypothetical protein
MLTGNKEEDLELLTTLYGQYGKRVLTPDYNVNYEILKNLDIKSLNRFCSTNQNAREICNNNQFWKEKFLMDKLPFIFSNRINTIEGWVKLYIQVKQTKTDVRRLLIVKKIINENVILIKGRKSVLYALLDIKSDETKNVTIKIQDFENDYNIIIGNDSFIINESSLNTILITIQYAILSNLDYSITDNIKIPYLVDQNVMNRMEQQRTGYYYNYITTLSERLAIYKSIVFLENNSEMLRD